MNPVKKILCLIDFLQHSDMVGQYAAMLAKTFGAEVEVVYVSIVFSDIGGHHEVDPAKLQGVEEDVFESSVINMESFMKKNFSGVKASSKILQGDAADEIIKYLPESKADLVVMGTQGRKGLNLLFFGSVAEKIVRSSLVPVLTLRSRN